MKDNKGPIGENNQVDRSHTGKTTAVIVAAGSGKRMNSAVKKQYMEIAGYPVLYHTLKAFEQSDIDDIIVVAGADETGYVQDEIVDRYAFKKVSCVCTGGKERFDSVFMGIGHICDDNREEFLHRKCHIQ